MDELNPCPFCRAKETDEDEPLGVWYSPSDDEWQVACDRCGANTDWLPEREEAIEAWNKGMCEEDVYK